ncbi:MAG: pilus assembly protein TadG-related protein, partial [Acidimicrobiales bacterium]
MASDRRLRSARDDRGVVVVLVAAVMGAILVMVALVLDLGGARRDREVDQIAADAAALAAVGDLGDGGADASSACEAAWSLVSGNLPAGATVSEPSCETFDAVCSPTTAREVVVTSGEHRITFTHPVPDGHDLLAGQDPGALDGPPCDRFGVRVEQDRANLWAAGQVELDVSAVGRLVRGRGNVDAPLILLEPSACEALRVGGTGTLQVEMSDGRPGYIAVDSDGSGCSNPKKVIYRLDGSPTVRAGAIAMWALAGTRLDAAYSPTAVDPVPTAASAPVGRTGMDWRYDCDPSAGCPGTGPAHITELEATWGTGGRPEGFTGWKASGRSCNLSGTTAVPAGDWYIDCGTGGLSSSGSLTFQGGNIVSQGPIEATGSGGLRVNCPDANPHDTLTSGACVAPSAPSVVVLRSGDLVAGSRLELHQTFVYLATGELDLDLTGSDTVLWTAP